LGQKDNNHIDEEHSHKRKNYNPHYQKKEGMCFEPRSLYYSIEPEVYIPYFDGNKNVKAYLEWETKVVKSLKNNNWMSLADFPWYPKFSRIC